MLMKKVEDNVVELDEYDLDIIKEYTDHGKLHPDFLPIVTYELCQCGYPYPDHGEMVARGWGGTDAEDKLLPSKGKWCKVDDVGDLIEDVRRMREVLIEITDKVSMLTYSIVEEERKVNSDLFAETMDALAKAKQSLKEK